MLSGSERDFLIHHRIDPDTLWDVRGWRSAEWKPQAKLLGVDFVLGEDCPYGHRLRTRYNHCIQCNVAAIAFLLRHGKPGWVYLAHSKTSKVVKVGSTKDLTDRLRNLNSQGYGNCVDWEYIAKAYANRMGELERKIRNAIPGAPVSATYRHRYSLETNKEMIASSPSVASRHFNRVVAEEDATDVWVQSSSGKASLKPRARRLSKKAPVARQFPP